MTRDQPTVFAAALIAFWFVVMCTGFVTSSGWITTPEGKPAYGDYIGVYSAGQLALRGEPASAYNPDRHKAAQVALVGDPKASFFPWPYPPSFLLVAAALALLPYFASMLAWSVATLGLCAAAIGRISASSRDMLLMLATPAPWLNLYIGQNGALSAALIGFGLILLPTQQVVAGICIGLLSFKPHLGLLVPVALLAGGYYRAFASAVATAVASALLATCIFGTEPWLALPEQLHLVTDIVRDAAPIQKIQSVFGLARSLGLSLDVALSLQGLTIAGLIAAVGWLWWRHEVSYNLKAAALAAAMTLASPYQFVYDLVILTIAQAFLLRHIAGTDADKIEIYGLILANVMVFYFAATPVPLGVGASVLVGSLIVRRIRMEATSSVELPAHSPVQHASGPTPTHVAATA